MEYTGKLYGEGGIPLMLTASDVDALRNRTSAPKYIMLEIQRGENDF